MTSATTAGSLEDKGMWRAVPVVAALEEGARWLFVAGLAAAMVTPRWAVGSVRFGISDVLCVSAVGCWVLAWFIAGSRPAALAVAKWPAMVVLAGVLSITGSVDSVRSIKGLIELLGLWVLPAIAVVGLFDSDRLRNRLLSGASIGALTAAAINITTAIRLGIAGGVPQVWGAAGGFQGYFQILGITVAIPRLASAVSMRRPLTIGCWACALTIHSVALLLTQTRGAWIAALFVAAVLGASGRRRWVLGAGAAMAAIIAVGWSAEWSSPIRERIQSVFRFDAELSGFDSSVIRVGLALTSLRMFLAHPLTGIGLKNFTVSLPYYAPDALPLVVAMGTDQVVTQIEGPHSTYLSLLAETGLIGFLAFCAWVCSSWTAAYREFRSQRTAEGSLDSQLASTLLGGVSAILVFNLFAEMNASGALPLVIWLSLAQGLKRRSVAKPAAHV